MLVKNPVVAGMAVVSLALGVGSNVAIYSIYSQFLLRPLPVSEPDRLVNLEAPGPRTGSGIADGTGAEDEVFSHPMFRDLERAQSVFTDVAAHSFFEAQVAYRGRPMSVFGTLVSGSYFPTLGLVPEAGRLLGPEVDEPIGAWPVVVLSHDFWQSDFSGSTDAIGRVLIVNGQALTIAGVAPAGFRGTTFGIPAEIFVPITMRGRLSAGDGEDGGLGDRRSYWTYLFARLKPSVSADQARTAMTPMYRNILRGVEAPLQTDMSEETLARFIAKPLLIRDGRRGHGVLYGANVPLLLLLGVTAIVVLIACANIANLLLARWTGRTAEMALRLSIGASRRHLLTQLLTESCLLALLGGAGALLVAHWTLDLIGALLPYQIAGRFGFALDPYAVPLTAAVSMGTGVLFGIFPAFHGTRGAVVSALKSVGGEPAGGRMAARFRSGLVVAQFAMSMILVVMAGLFVQSLRNVNRVELGLRSDDVVTFRLCPACNGYNDTQARALYDRVEEELTRQPGVDGVTAASVAVFSGQSRLTDVMVDGVDADRNADRSTQFNQIGTDYFRTLGIPVLRGRTFTVSDVREAAPVAVVNEAFARKFGLGRNAVGRRVGGDWLNGGLDTEIVGLVADTRYFNVRAPVPPVLYVPYRQEDAVDSLAFYVRSTLGPDGMLRTIPAVVASLDPNLPVILLTTLSGLVRDSAFESRVTAVLSAAFAGLGTLLAAVGLYGVVAYTVAQRTREFGLRMALGANAARLRATVFGHVARMALAGGAVGLVAALGLGRAARSMLYEVDRLPPAVIVAAVVVLMAVALSAGLGPAYRASRIDPMAALRHE